ncbi:GNAT family N-acetyltransferase [Paenibacillus thiaminolyticus]|uniref:GNAT family N-acetyltransferase n=1 Tax=Paenibacillus thiaminolyticus TaxID=49283 RepID=UPI001165C3B3|nr:GNAT family N-acetyltransferase [Paenibacillus thiaminolyticus]NGP57240.1 GNAT family N-acetyltransferase [Paenibacillus thiaminolyticus]WCR27574.1 GNAT family N-acetyltransferase [Paenibacillus thiaminolyticus]
MVIQYKDTKRVAAADVARVFQNSGIRRPFHDLPRIQRMIDHSGPLITARAGQQMVGIARAVSDFSYCCYLSELAVDRSFLISVPEAEAFFLKAGFIRSDRSYIIPRSR